MAIGTTEHIRIQISFFSYFTQTITPSLSHFSCVHSFLTSLLLKLFVEDEWNEIKKKYIKWIPHYILHKYATLHKTVTPSQYFILFYFFFFLFYFFYFFSFLFFIPLLQQIHMLILFDDILRNIAKEKISKRKNKNYFIADKRLIIELVSISVSHRSFNHTSLFNLDVTAFYILLVMFSFSVILFYFHLV